MTSLFMILISAIKRARPIMYLTLSRQVAPINVNELFPQELTVEQRQDPQFQEVL